MRRALLIFLSLVLALAGWSAVCADDGFYVISGVKRNYAPVPKTGCTTSSAAGDDGAWQKGISSPSPRFTNNGNGTVTDLLTGLIWANGGIFKTWANALSLANGLASGSAGLTDGSQVGDWRLPNIRELSSLIDYGQSFLAVPADFPFRNLIFEGPYWSSTRNQSGGAFVVGFIPFSTHASGESFSAPLNSSYTGVLCVRGGR